jgi:hypothetical protein
LPAQRLWCRETNEVEGEDEMDKIARSFIMFLTISGLILLIIVLQGLLVSIS